MSAAFLDLFRSNPESVVLRKSIGKERDRDGKLAAQYVTVRRAPSAKDVELHLAGRVCIVAKPDLADDTCWWASIDFDIYRDKPAVARLIDEITVLKLPLHVSESKSGGIHGTAFFSKPVPCAAARAELSKWAAMLGYPNAEVFPKPVQDGKIPFGIALPFFGEPERFKAFTPQFYELQVNGNGWTPPQGNRGLEEMTAEDERNPSIALPEHVKDFGALLTAHRLKFQKRPENGGISYDYHNVGGQPCLLACKVHEANKTNPRCSRFFEKDRRVVHHCFDDDNDPGEHRTRKALFALGIVLEPTEAVGPAPGQIAATSELRLPDMPESVLDGRLGEICKKHLKDFPIAYSWPALLAAAGALVRPVEWPAATIFRANLYVALVGPVSSGKSTAIERACHFAEVLPPLLQEIKSGSAEGLLKKLGDRKGGRVFLFPDELSHLLDKAQIIGASFPSILNTLFYKDKADLTIAQGKEVSFNCRMSVVGGLTAEKFGESFGAATIGGLYDRFLFGQCPTGFEYLWRPIEGTPALEGEFDEMPVNQDVWDARDDLKTKEKLTPRVLELALRCAAICAAIDGRELRAADLGPAWEMARYQNRVRMLLRPNAGKNLEGQVASKLLDYLDAHSLDEKFHKLRDVLTAAHAYDFGPALCERVINSLAFAGEIEKSEIKNARGRKVIFIRRVK